MSTALKVVAWVLGSVLLLVLLGVGLLWWGLSGGWDGIRPAAQADDRRVVQARDEGVEPLARLADPVEDAVAAAGAGLGRAEVDGCETGQNNWKTQDGYTLSCAQVSVLGGTSAAASADDAAADLDRRVRELGWTPAEYGELEPVGDGGRLQGRYTRTDDPDAVLVLSVADPGRASPYLNLGRVDSTDEEPALPVLEAVQAASQVSVLVTVERTYFQDD